MNTNIRALLLFLSTIPLLTGFQSCKWPSCCDHNKEEKTTSSSEIPNQENQERKDVIHVIKDEESFNDLIKKPTIVKFTASWCGACKIIQPTYEKIAQELHSKYQFVTLDVDKFSALADKYNIRGMPTFLFFDQGEKLEGQIIGAGVKYEEFINKINDIFNH